MIVVFDIGNVLVRWDRRYLYRKVFNDEDRMERFLATALGMDFVSHTDVAQDFAAAVAARANRSSKTSRCCGDCARPASPSTPSVISLMKHSRLQSANTIS